MGYRGFFNRQDNNFDLAIIERIGQFNQHPSIFNFFKTSFYLHITFLLVG